MSRSFLSVALLLAVVSGLGFRSSQDEAPKPSASPFPRIKLVGASISEGEQSTVSLKLEFTNPGATSLAFFGYPADSFDPPLVAGVIWPFYQIEFMREGNWEPYFIGRCGTGAGTVEVAPQSSGTFDAEVIAPNDWQAVKVSINQTPTETEIDPDQVTITWSRIFYRNEIESAPK
jgi:hypothetical protein